MTVLGVMFFDNHISPGYYFSYGTLIVLSKLGNLTCTYI